ncbi:AAA family ATPase [Herbaspirillum sp. RTI4]|uniref:AAA family ATPase n=1 Tax=Herbaspirillum sp. RTI4 TaxID=3048640 RepID=UPI002AB3953E|nr:AAA family ATPase [Herbaspirillum sp. RTI4]MDY7579439.1 AAA family ATPase [Herbaspirillum sp. RTI4]MEA9980353.1 AAA family ATPase [Herbaspirillum sp. RTI4]
MIATTTSTESQFAVAMAAYGLMPTEIVADGERHRFDAPDDKRGRVSGWYRLHGDGVPAGSFGNWKTGLSEKWCGKADKSLTPAERTEYHARIERAKQEAEFTHLQLEADAAKLCIGIWAAARDATDDNAYCIRKGIKPYGLKEFKDKRTLIVPIRDGTGTLTSLQFIDEDGVKRFKTYGKIKACYYSFGGKPTDTVLLCEGFATGASLHAVIGYPVAVAFNAGNLEAVAQVLRAKLPGIKIIVCADNDRFTEGGNVGVMKATAAAQSVSGLLALPVFASDDSKPTDFNDLHQQEGADAVRACFDTVQAVPLAADVDHGDDAPAPAPTKAVATGKPGDRAVKIRCGAEIKPQPITWLWEGWLPAGKLTILAGAAGTGKTTLALGLAAALTSGGRWPDASHCTAKGNVLIWSSEDVADDTLVPRLIASGADLNRCHFIEGITENGESAPFDPAQDILSLHHAVERMGGVSLLLIDPIVSAVSGDMHRANDVRRSLQAVVDFAEAHQCAVIGITHFAKGGAGKAPQDRVIGSQAFGALARMVLVAAKEEDGTRRVLARAKSNIAPDDGGVAYSLALTTIDGGIEATHAVWEGAIEGTAREILGDVEHDEDGGGAERDDLERMLIDTLTDNGGRMQVKMLQAEIRDAGHSWDAAKRVKKSLGIDSIKASMGGSWMWCLPIINLRREHEGSEGSTENKALPSHPSALPSQKTGDKPFPESNEIEVEL